MAGSITFFKSGGAGTALGPFDQDSFSDTSVPATSNAGFSTSILKNPLNAFFGNDDIPRYGPKTLSIKDLVLVADRSKWVSGAPTYQVVFEESFPAAVAYVWGNIQIVRNFDQTYILIRKAGDGFGVTGAFRRAQFILNQDVAATGTGTVQVDGAGSATIDYSNLATDSNTFSRTNRISAFVHAAANETYDIHDFRLIANEVSTMRISGVVVYSENSGANIDFFPGSTYNNKTKLTTTAGYTLALPSLGSTLGGNALLYKGTGATYLVSALPAQMISTLGTASSGGNVISVTAGTGASFPIGTGFVSKWTGPTLFIGTVGSVSGDNLTVNPAFTFGTSGPINLYKYFSSGQSLPISATLNRLAYTFGSTQMSGFTASYLKPDGKLNVWGANMGVTSIDGVYPTVSFASASGFVQVDGYFSAAEVEFYGVSFAVLSGMFSVNGLSAYVINNLGVTGFIKKTIFTDAGPGWNSFAFFPGSSHTNVGIARIDLYTRSYDQGVTFGLLSHFDTLQGFAPTAVSATNIAPGTYQRYYADQLPLKGTNWVRQTGATCAGGVNYALSSTGSLRFEYYGKNFAILGAGSTFNVTLDGVAVNSAYNVMNIVATEGFHTIGMTYIGSTVLLAAIDITRTVGEFKNLQNYLPRPELKNVPIPDDGQSYFEPGMTPNNVGVPTGFFCSVQRVGNWAEVILNFKPASVTGSAASISLPSNMTIDSDELAKGTDTVVGTYHATTSTGTLFYTGYAGIVFFDGSDTSKVYCSHKMGTTSGRIDKENTSTLWDGSPTEPTMIKFRIPISGWSRKRR